MVTWTSTVSGGGQDPVTEAALKCPPPKYALLSSPTTFDIDRAVLYAARFCYGLTCAAPLLAKASEPVTAANQYTAIAAERQLESIFPMLYQSEELKGEGGSWSGLAASLKNHHSEFRGVAEAMLNDWLGSANALFSSLPNPERELSQQKIEGFSRFVHILFDLTAIGEYSDPDEIGEQLVRAAAGCGFSPQDFELHHKGCPEFQAELLENIAWVCLTDLSVAIGEPRYLIYNFIESTGSARDHARNFLSDFKDRAEKTADTIHDMDLEYAYRDGAERADNALKLMPPLPKISGSRRLD